MMSTRRDRCYIEHKHTLSIAECTSSSQIPTRSLLQPSCTSMIGPSSTRVRPFEFGEIFGDWKKKKLKLHSSTSRSMAPPRKGREVAALHLPLGLPFIENSKSHSTVHVSTASVGPLKSTLRLTYPQHQPVSQVDTPVEPSNRSLAGRTRTHLLSHAAASDGK